MYLHNCISTILLYTMRKLLIYSILRQAKETRKRPKQKRYTEREENSKLRKKLKDFQKKLLKA